VALDSDGKASITHIAKTNERIKLLVLIIFPLYCRVTAYFKVELIPTIIFCGAG
jgi:hypothetical protein